MEIVRFFECVDVSAPGYPDAAIERVADFHTYESLSNLVEKRFTSEPSFHGHRPPDDQTEQLPLQR